MIHFKSEQVKVFPCSYRGYLTITTDGTIEQTTEHIPYDAESRMLTEHNFLHSGNLINIFGNSASDNTFIISCSDITTNDDNKLSIAKLKCVIHGYYFEISNLILSAPAANSNCFLGISLKPISIVGGSDQSTQITNVLSSIDVTAQENALISETTTDLYLDYIDENDNNTAKFSGLVFANATEKNDYNYEWLELLKINHDEDNDTYSYSINEAAMMIKTKISEAEGDIVMTNKPQTIISAKTFTSTAPLDIHTEQVLNSNITNATVTNANVTNATITNANITGATITSETVTDSNITNATITNATVTNIEITNAIITNLNNDTLLANGKKIKRGSIEVTVPDYDSQKANYVLIVNSSGNLQWVPYYDGTNVNVSAS